METTTATTAQPAIDPALGTAQAPRIEPWMRHLMLLGNLAWVWLTLASPLPVGVGAVLGLAVSYAAMTPFRRREAAWERAVESAGIPPVETGPAMRPGFRRGLLAFLGLVALLVVLDLVS